MSTERLKQFDRRWQHTCRTNAEHLNTVLLISREIIETLVDGCVYQVTIKGKVESTQI